MIRGMIEKLKNMEPLPEEETRKLSRRTHIAVIAAAACLIAFVVWMIVAKRQFEKLYFVLVWVFLAFYWILSDVVPVFYGRAFAGRSDEQIKAYIKAAGLSLLGDIGLGLFVSMLSQGSLFGAIIYFAGMTGSRKQREIYRKGSPDDGSV